MKIKPLILGDYRIDHPFTTPSGLVTTTPDTMHRIADEIPEIGFVTSKTITPRKRRGNKPPILHELGIRTYLNAVGLANPGGTLFAEEMRDIYPLPKGKFLLTSISAKDPDGFARLAKKLAPFTDGFELNVSCPHTKGYGIEVGMWAEKTANTIRAVREVTDKPIVVKLPPVEYVGRLAKASVNAGADAIAVSNTFGPYESEILTNRRGGMSGREIKKRSLWCVEEVRNAVDVPIIAMGGIECADDVRDYRHGGANAFALGSGAVPGMDTEQLKEYTDPNLIQVAVERYMKCGTGMCGSCAVNGYRSCRDGPVFEIEEVGDVLGRYTRDSSGARINF